MVLKFDEYIKEGFLSKTYDRYRTGEKRLEDKLPMYIVCEKMSKYLSEQYKQECIYSISKYEPKGTVAEYDIEVYVKDVDFILHVTVPLNYNDDEVKCGDCMYDAIVGEILYNSDGKSKGQYKNVLKIMNKGIRKIYGFE